MKFLILWLMILAGVVMALIYVFGHAFITLIRDWHVNREVDEIRAAQSDHRAQVEERSRHRLENGCEHDFGTHFGEFPPGVCPKCGLGKEKPIGGCDHVWRRQSGPVPNSLCEKCGRTYSASREPGERVF